MTIFVALSEEQSAQRRELHRVCDGLRSCQGDPRSFALLWSALLETYVRTSCIIDSPHAPDGLLLRCMGFEELGRLVVYRSAVLSVLHQACAISALRTLDVSAWSSVCAVLMAGSSRAYCDDVVLHGADEGPYEGPPAPDAAERASRGIIVAHKADVYLAGATAADGCQYFIHDERGQLRDPQRDPVSGAYVWQPVSGLRRAMIPGDWSPTPWRLAASAMLIGVCAQAFERLREDVGAEAISRHSLRRRQDLRHRIVDAQLSLEGARWLVWRAACDTREAASDVEPTARLAVSTALRSQRDLYGYLGRDFPVSNEQLRSVHAPFRHLEAVTRLMRA